MHFNTLILAALATCVLGQTNTTAFQQCVQQNNCAAGDVACLGHCAGVPVPNQAMVNATSNCIATQCNQNDTAAWATCRNNCIQQFFMGSPPPPGSSVNGSANSTSAAGYEGGRATTNILGAGVLMAIVAMY